MTALPTSFGREVLLGVSFPHCTPSPLPSPLLFLFTSSQGTRSLRTLIFPVSQYLLNWPLLFSRAFPLPACPVLVPPRGFYGHWRGQETAHGFLQLCRAARAEARGRQTGIGSAESPGPSASDRLFQHGHGGWGTLGCQWGAAAPEPPPCCPPGGGGRGGSCGWQLPKAPANFLQLRRGEVEPWLWAAPRQGRMREAFMLSASSVHVLGPVWCHRRSRNSTEAWGTGRSPHLCRAGGSCRCSQQHHQCTCPGSGRGWKHIR